MPCNDLCAPEGFSTPANAGCALRGEGIDLLEGGYITVASDFTRTPH